MDQRGGIEIAAEPVEQGPRLGVQGGAVHLLAKPRAFERQVGDEDVFGDREVGQDRYFLRQKADAVADGFFGLVVAHRLVVEADDARVAAVHAAEDFHQSRFPRSIGSEQCQNLPGV